MLMTRMKPILVKGSHRSGTTWAGRMLAKANGVAYIHETLSSNPIQEFKILYNQSGLEYTQKVQEEILKSSASHNPKEQRRGSKLKRDSRENVKSWQQRLSDDEINKIREETAQIASCFTMKVIGHD
jgi:hypothetical protein